MIQAEATQLEIPNEADCLVDVSPWRGEMTACDLKDLGLEATVSLTDVVQVCEDREPADVSVGQTPAQEARGPPAEAAKLQERLEHGGNVGAMVR
jgi:hypothetical protein